MRSWRQPGGRTPLRYLAEADPSFRELVPNEGYSVGLDQIRAGEGVGVV